MKAVSSMRSGRVKFNAERSCRGICASDTAGQVLEQAGKVGLRHDFYFASSIASVEWIGGFV